MKEKATKKPYKLQIAEGYVVKSFDQVGNMLTIYVEKRPPMETLPT